MPECHCPDLPQLPPATSRLGRALMRLAQSAQQQHQLDTQSEALFAAWERRWGSRRAEISRRLALIEARLEGCSPAPDTRPRLCVFGSRDCAPSEVHPSA